jgi:hypothetical protein
MTRLALIFGICLLVISLLGWGTSVARLARVGAQNWAVTLCVGLGAVVFLGGVLNLLGIAYGWALDAVVLSGIGLAIGFRRHTRSMLGPDAIEMSYAVPIGLLVLLVMGANIAIQAPPSAFNLHDDYEKYFAFPVRMLQTGTLAGNPLSTMGVETLGGVSFLHAVVINHFPITYINVLDGVIGLLLCLLLTVSVLPPRTQYLPYSALGVLVVAFINPQYVNASALYIGSAVVMASTLLLTERRADDAEKGSLPSPIVAGLLFATLCALKMSLPIFPVLQGAIFCAMVGLSDIPIRRTVKWGASTVVMTAAFLSPWLLLHLTHYLHLNPVPLQHQVDASAAWYSKLLSPGSLYWGGRWVSYTFIAAATAFAPLLLHLAKRRGSKLHPQIRLAGLASSAFAAAIAFLLILAKAPNTDQGSLRYAIPILLGAAPVVLTLSVRCIEGDEGVRRRAVIGTIAALEMLIVAGFALNLAGRYFSARQSGNALAFRTFASDTRYLAYSRQVLFGDVADRIRSAQSAIPPGEAFLAAVSAPYHLDFRRNRVYETEPSGVDRGWPYLPESIDYFMIQVAGYAVRETVTQWTDVAPLDPERPWADRYGGFVRYIQRARRNAEELYNDGEIIVFKWAH